MNIAILVAAVEEVVTSTFVFASVFESTSVELSSQVGAKISGNECMFLDIF